jgi:hypothetical protein
MSDRGKGLGPIKRLQLGHSARSVAINDEGSAILLGSVLAMLFSNRRDRGPA